MKKTIVTLLLSIMSTTTVLAENTVGSNELQIIEVKPGLLLISVIIVLIGVVAVSIANYIAYRKTNLKDLIAQYSAKANRSHSHSNNRNHNHYNDNGEFNRQMQQQMNDEMNRQMMEQAMEEGRKSVTPFDHGGYVQGAGFNPSDTAAQQMNDMNNMNMGMF